MRDVYALFRPAASILLILTLAGCGSEGSERVTVESYASPTPVPDADQDGYTEIQGDCDDSNASVYPGAAEGTANEDGKLVGDGIDNNCDGRIDDGTIDFDNDQDGYSEVAGDCDDANGLIHPATLDGCDSIDNDCDGVIDEDAVDAFEPNDTQDVASEIGDITCNTAGPYPAVINIYPAGDVDFFRFVVKHNSQCTFAARADLVGDLDGLDFYMTLYHVSSSGGALVPVDSLSSTASTGDTSVQYTGSASDSDTYYVEVGAPDDATTFQCHDEIRLLLYGFKP